MSSCTHTDVLQQQIELLGKQQSWVKAHANEQRLWNDLTANTSSNSIKALWWNHKHSHTPECQWRRVFSWAGLAVRWVPQWGSWARFWCPGQEKAGRLQEEAWSLWHWAGAKVLVGQEWGAGWAAAWRPWPDSLSENWRCCRRSCCVLIGCWPRCAGPGCPGTCPGPIRCCSGPSPLCRVWRWFEEE